jgi:hypothetical protein
MRKINDRTIKDKRESRQLYIKRNDQDIEGKK